MDGLIVGADDLWLIPPPILELVVIVGSCAFSVAYMVVTSYSVTVASSEDPKPCQPCANESKPKPSQDPSEADGGLWSLLRGLGIKYKGLNN